MRSETAGALSSARLTEWQGVMDRAAREIVTRLSVSEPVDLVAQFARPWCLIVAATITGVQFTDAEALVQLAQDVSAAAADPYDAAARAKAKIASSRLERRFLSGPPPLREPAFVGLSQTLPSMLANMWVVLFAHPHEYAKLRANAALIPGAMGGITTMCRSTQNSVSSRNAGRSYKRIQDLSGPTCHFETLGGAS